MKNPSPSPNSPRPGFTMMEILVAIAIVLALAAIAFTVSTSMKEKANLANATSKLREIGSAFTGYTSDSGGLLPLEDAPGKDSWTNAAKPENDNVWYNAIPRSMGSPSVGDLAREPERFYDPSYPLYLKGAPYPKSDKKLRDPYFAFGMNSRLQRKDDNDVKQQGTLASIVDHSRTVAFLERGMPGDKKVSPVQRGFDAGPKANPRAFAGRYGERGVLVFVDGHAEVRSVNELIERGGMIPFPQTEIIWTADPNEDPN